jgi:hypothetical protein
MMRYISKWVATLGYTPRISARNLKKEHSQKRSGNPNRKRKGINMDNILIKPTEARSEAQPTTLLITYT